MTVTRHVYSGGWQLFDMLLPTDGMLVLDAVCDGIPGWKYIHGFGAVFESKANPHHRYYRFGELDEATLFAMEDLNREIKRELEQERGK